MHSEYLVMKINRLCKYVTRLLEIVYPEMVYTDDVKKKDVTCSVYKGAEFGYNVL